jgi:hypothetical protein
MYVAVLRRFLAGAALHFLAVPVAVVQAHINPRCGRFFGIVARSFWRPA